MRKKNKLPDFYSYPAIFEKESEECWFADFPDLVSCATNATTLEEAIIQAQNVLEDYLAICEKDGMDIPPPTPIEETIIPEGAIAQRVVVSMKSARKRWEDKAVNRMVTLPAWMDEMGRASNLNFSQLLQAAVMKELSI